MKSFLFTLYSKKISQLLITEHKNVLSSWSKYDLCSSISLWVAEQHQTKQKLILLSSFFPSDFVQTESTP